MRLKQNILMILLLSLMLGLITTASIAKKNSKPEESEVVPEIIEEVIPETFCKAINNADNVPSEVLDTIKNYMDDYFLSLYTLELQDTTKYFSNVIDGKVSDAAIKLTVESRKLYDFDFTMSDAYYVLNITQCVKSDGKYVVDFLEDDSFCFKFLSGITSETYDVENTMTLEKVNDEYKICGYEKTQGYYMMFNDSKNDDSIENIYDFFYKRLVNTIENENYQKSKAEATAYVPSKSAKVKYDRNAASEYASKYYHIRNEDYYDFDDEGGNCQNFASQCLVKGGMVMDESGDCQWYYNNHLDYVAPWVHVTSFRDYCNENEGKGLVCEVGENMYYAEPGDIVQVGISSISHTCIVSKIVDGHILLNSNSIDMKDFPLESYTYPTRKLIKILGSNS